MNFSKLLDKLKKYQLVREILTDEGIQQFKRYVITGMTTFVVEYSLFYLFHEIIFGKYRLIGFELAHKWFGADTYTYKYLLSNTIVYSIDFCLNFTINRVYSFKSKAPLMRQVKRYGILYLANLAITSVLLYMFADMLELSPYISKFLAMNIIISWNFIIYKKFIYK
ncbi:MAG: GtrA family protein [Clostridiales bacterium]|nr:GtrA family protein [Clostridiales bacterium]